MTTEAPKTKPPSKEKRDAPLTRIAKPNTKTVTIAKQPSATSLNQTANAKAAPLDKSNTKAALVPASAKGKRKMSADSEDVQTKKPAQSQIAVHAHSQRPDAEPPVASETIELPEPNSEYSDSEDEGRQPKLDVPEWTQSPELRAALESQSRVNPDDIFGPVRPLRMEDIFRTRTSRFRARTSSANWSGPDGLKQEEEREYARRMGFR
jgi:Inner centromere protein, ARK binding region